MLMHIHPGRVFRNLKTNVLWVQVDRGISEDEDLLAKLTPANGWVELVNPPVEESRTDSHDPSHDAAIDSHLITAKGDLRRSNEVSIPDGHAQLCATQALVEAAVALVAAVRPTPTMTGEVTREGDNA